MPSTPVSPRLVDGLLTAGRPTAPALIEADRVVTYDQLQQRVASRADALDLPDRSIVVLAGDRSLEYVVTYLALMRDGHVPLLAGDHADRLAEAWSAAAVVRADGDGVDIRRRRHEVHELHPDLALLCSTSGSTGSPKLVRLSQRNLHSNATAISDYLALTDADCAITSLPLHYCYGLSVLHSHLLSGARVVVTDASVVDPCFRTAMENNGVTNLAGVPHTFDMLECNDPEHVRVPSLRFVTQAGGRLAPDAVARWVGRTRSWGADFYVMYGQTEATARMAYLPPELAEHRPDAIGIPIPGGAFELRPVAECADDVGELVFSGPNVMMGYATTSDDLAAEPGPQELPTGDLARFHVDDGVYEIVGRRSRFVKPFGIRIDLDDVERSLRQQFGAEVAVTGDDHRLLVLAPAADATSIANATGALTGMPPRRVTTCVDRPIPRTAAGKIDYPALASLGAEPEATAAEATAAGTASPDVRHAVIDLYADVLGRRPVDPSQSFVSLGGDSLSYVECAVRLEALMGRLPSDWHLLAIDDLAVQQAPRTRLARLDTTVAFRAVAICLVVATHMRIWFWPGGAHLLLAVVGFNLARFMMPIESTSDRVRAGVHTATRAAVPTVLWVGAGMALFGAYSGGTLLLVNNYVGPPSHRDDHWTFWFIEVFVHLVLLTTAALAIPAVRRWERRYPYAFPLVVLMGALVLRHEWFQLGDFYNMRYRTHSVAWFFVLGWLVQRSVTRPQRLVTTVLCLVTAPHFFDYAPREWFIAGALVVLVWWREVPVPRPLTRPLAVVASASMWIFVTHFTFWPVLLDIAPPPVAYVATIAAGVAVWALVERVTGALGGLQPLPVVRRRRAAAAV